MQVAFTNYLDKFVINGEEQVLKPEELSQSKSTLRNVSTDQFKQTPLFAVLQNLTKYAVGFAATFSTQEENDIVELFGHSCWHALLKLYQHCHDAVELLKNLDKRELSIAYKEANYHLQNIMEYLIALDSLEQMQRKIQGKENARLVSLLNTEKNYAKSNFNLAEKQVNVYLLDNGQQAITTTLLAMDFELFLQEAHEQRGQNSIYNFNESYYELDLFLQDVGGLKNTSKAESTIVFIDITQLDKLKLGEFKQINALVIDITRQPDLTDIQLKKIIADAHKLGIWVVLSASCLKHDELGADKYTAGKIITLAPKQDKSLSKDVIDIFEGVANHSMHPVVASYLQMVNEICGDKPIVQSQLDEVSTAGLNRYGLLKSSTGKIGQSIKDVSLTTRQTYSH